MLGDPFAEREIDAVGVIDENAQGFGAGLLESDDVELEESSSESWLWMSS